MAIDATTGITDLVQALHSRIARTPTGLAGPLVSGAVNGITDLVYSSVRGATRAVGGGLDALLGQLDPLLGHADGDGAHVPAAAPNRARQAVLAALNGVLGDYLEQTRNPLAIPMSVRQSGRSLVLDAQALRSAIERPSGSLLLLAHGLCMNDLQWERAAAGNAAHDHGAAMARDLGLVPLYLHYNSGRHISSNGRELAAQLDALVKAWPVKVGRLVLLGHSMGGLVIRSALHYGEAEGHHWPQCVGQVLFLGAPHHGAPLERGGHWVDTLLESTGYTAPFARLGRIRSAGITDLRHGSVLEDDWHGHGRFAHGHDTRAPLPLPSWVRSYAIAATTTSREEVERCFAPGKPLTLDAVGMLAGDGLVPVASALGMHPDPRFALGFAPDDQCVAAGIGHLDLLGSAAVYEQMHRWLKPA